jgi:hypothetical protein
MKRIFTSLMGLFLLTITTLSCTKDDGQYEMRQEAVTPQVINAKVPAGQAYTFNMGAGVSASIQKQALHFQVSEIATAPNGGSVYKYVAGKGFSGVDEVTLQQTITSTMQGSSCHSNNMNGSSMATAVKTIVIKLNVAN